MMKRILALLILCLLAVPALAQASALSSGSTGDEVVALQQRLAADTGLFCHVFLSFLRAARANPFR